MVEELSENKFQSFIKQGNVVVDFFAEWCLAPGTEIIFNPCIKKISEAKSGSRVLSFDEDFNESFAEVKSTHIINHNKRINIKTKRGREILCTPEHLILTDKGFVKAEEIFPGQLVAVYSLSDHPKIEDDKRIFLSEEKIREAAINLGLDKERYIKELKEKGLLEIKYNEEKAYVLASLIGFLLADGSMSNLKNNERMIEFFVGKKEDKKELEKDLAYLGFEAYSNEQEIKGKIGEREFIQKGTRIRISKTSLFILLYSLGGIIGEKFIKGLKIPGWVSEGPKEIKRAFLQGFLGGDGPKVCISRVDRKDAKSYNKPNINAIEFHFYSEAENKAEKFAEEISSFLNIFNVKIRNIEIKKEDRYERKDKKISILLKINLNSSMGFAYNYSLIGFKYSQTKKLESALAREYLLERLVKHKEREEKKQQAINSSKNQPINEIAKNLEVSYSVVNNWLSGKKAFLPRDCINYNEWLKMNVFKKNILFDSVSDIKKEEGSYNFVSLSLNNETKMFVANGIIHHNCMPCLMMSPVIDELSLKLKKIKFGKVNIGDNESLASKLKVISIPTLVIFKDGKEIARITGALQADVLEEKLKTYL
ncbi:MAG: thioredoxin domain-containing protein [Candidatus Pacearchaeota archaeon]|nr:thioredoxin domain-containing protein [Candidatus Pacearchaeota archaeon]